MVSVPGVPSMFYATEHTYPHLLLAINYMIQFGERFKEERKEERRLKGAGERKYGLDLDQHSSQYSKACIFLEYEVLNLRTA